MATTAVKVRSRAQLDRQSADGLAVALKAVADPARLQILDILKSRPDLEACVCEFTAPLNLSQPTVSHHLKVLTNAGILDRERRGSWAWFRLNAARLEQIASLLHA